MTDDRGTPATHGPASALTRPGPPGPSPTRPPDRRTGDLLGAACAAAPAPVPLPEAGGPRDAVTRLRAHGCWYPSAHPDGSEAAFICDRGGVPQLWAGPVDGDDVRLLDSSPDPVKEVSWSPDGRWIAYTTAPGGGEHSRVLCVRPDGTGRRILAGADPASSAYLGCWAHDGSAVAVTVAAPAAAYGGLARQALTDYGPADGRLAVTLPAADWADRDGHATLLGPAAYDAASGTAPNGTPTGATAPAARPDGGLSVYLTDPDGLASPVLLVTETHAASLRACDLSHDGRLALLRRGPRGRREAVVLRTADSVTTLDVPVADGDPWIGRFSRDGRTLWLRSNHDREYAALLAVGLDADGAPHAVSVAAERAGSDLELLALAHDGRTAALSWNVRGASELELVETFPAGRTPDPAERTPDDTGPARPLDLPHEVVTRVTAAGAGRLLLALSGSQRRPGVWWAHEGVSLLRTPWSSQDEDAVPPGRPPVRPVPVRLTARDGLPLNGWYYRAPGRAPDEPAPCVIHLHGGPEEQERPVFNPLYHELVGRGLDVFAPDVRGSLGHGRSFVDADLGAGRFAALDDVADCAVHAVTAGPADPTRLAVMGRSYGGYLTFASLVWHPDLFRTGVAVCGMSDFLTFFAGTEPWIAESAAYKYGHPERDRELLRALSPMSRIDALRVPLLAVHGEHDTNVPPGESQQFVRAARERGIHAELLTLRDEGHDFLRAENRRLFRRAAADWMQRHLHV
ncbi:prolyl oligopeptidase family serine peptidase [Streptomyces sp. NRRL WC-3725]|uniref:S9 family peptidase n=1 Tax=Streptomyces sp. NRRL WC-3725 TaxID=1463933 RepID=UPI0004C6CD37|nr:prolyl oligopeptidase family serine peptidase [Streptomyces sp. NRRL WC-3725]